MDEQAVLQDIVELAGALIDGRRSALQTGRAIASLPLSEHPCWTALGGAEGLLPALYAAADEADRQFFLGSDIEEWNALVVGTKREELARAEERWHSAVHAACVALMRYAYERR